MTHLKTWALSFVKEVSIKTNDVAGDGTTTATLLAQALIREGHEKRNSRRQSDDFEKGIQKRGKYSCKRINREFQKSNLL